MAYHLIPSHFEHWLNVGGSKKRHMVATCPMMGLLHAAHRPFDSVLTPCRVMFSLRFAISSFSVSVLDPPVLLDGETVEAACEFTDCAAVETELVSC